MFLFKQYYYELHTMVSPSLPVHLSFQKISSRPQFTNLMLLVYIQSVIFFQKCYREYPSNISNLSGDFNIDAY